MKKLTIIIPCFNEKDSIKPLYNSVCKMFSEISGECELVFVDDGSQDETLDVIKEIQSSDSRCNYISFTRNFGKESAIFAGLQNSDSEYTAIMDADMQDPPDLILQMHEILEKSDYDLCRTHRTTRNGEPVIRSWFAHLFYNIFNNFSPVKIPDGARDFCLLKRNVVNALLKIQETNRFSKEIISWLGFKTYWLNFQNTERVAGCTKWSFYKLFSYAMDCFINFPQIPIAIFSLIFFISVFLLILTGIKSVIFVCFLNLLYLGFLSLYLGKIFQEVKHRPLYIIRETSINSAV